MCVCVLQNGHTPMSFAAEYGNLEMCKWLQTKGADVNGRVRFSCCVHVQLTMNVSQGEQTPLLSAACGGYLSLCQWLHSVGASLAATKNV